MKNKINYLKILGLVLFIFIISRLDLNNLMLILRGARVEYLVMGILLFLPFFVIKAFRWYYILRLQGIKIDKLESMAYFASSLFWGTVTPGKIGQFSKALFIKEKGYSFGKSLSSAFLDRLFDIGLLALLGYAGLLIYMEHFRSQFFLLTVTLLGIIITSVVLYMQRGNLKNLIRYFVGLIVPVKQKEWLKQNYADFINSFSVLRIPDVMRIAIMSVAAWSFYYAEAYLFSKVLSLNISFFTVFALVSVAGLLSLLPISISGIGTRDAAFIILFQAIGHSREAAVAYSLLILTMIIFNTVFCYIGWVLYCRYRPRLVVSK